MKKIKFLVMSIIACFALIACTSTDSLVSQYEKACQKHDAVKALEIATKLEQKESKLTPEQIKRVEEASLELYK